MCHVMNFSVFLFRLQTQLEAYERQMRKLQKAAETHKQEKDRSMKLTTSVKASADMAELTIKQQNEEIKALQAQTESLSRKVKKIERFGCLIS